MPRIKINFEFRKMTSTSNSLKSTLLTSLTKITPKETLNIKQNTIIIGPSGTGKSAITSHLNQNILVEDIDKLSQEEIYKLLNKSSNSKDTKDKDITDSTSDFFVGTTKSIDFIDCLEKRNKSRFNHFTINLYYLCFDDYFNVFCGVFGLPQAQSITVKLGEKEGVHLRKKAKTSKDSSKSEICELREIIRDLYEINASMKILLLFCTNVILHPEFIPSIPHSLISTSTSTLKSTTYKSCPSKAETTTLSSLINISSTTLSSLKKDPKTSQFINLPLLHKLIIISTLKSSLKSPDNYDVFSKFCCLNGLVFKKSMFLRAFDVVNKLGLLNTGLGGSGSSGSMEWVKDGVLEDGSMLLKKFYDSKDI